MKQVIVGWFNFVFSKESKLAKERKKFCKVCKENKFGVCKLCKCPLIAKRRSPESYCPLGKW